MTNYQNHNKQMKAKDLFYKSMMFLCAIAFLSMLVFTLNGCTVQPGAKLETREVCEDGLTYKLVGKTMKAIIVNDDGSFKECESGQITF